MKDTAGVLKKDDSGLLLPNTRKRQLELFMKTRQNNNNKKGLEWGAEKLPLLPFDLRNKVVVEKRGLAVRLRSAIEANCFFQSAPPRSGPSFCLYFFFSFLYCHGLLSSFLTSDFYRTQCKHKYLFQTTLQCFLYARSFWCDLYAVRVRFKLFLSIRCLGW